MEYPGYGVYDSPKDELTILKDSLILFDFLIDTLKFAPENIIVFGRSIGTGPATYLASQRKHIMLLLLFSPFIRLKEIAKDYFSVLSIFFKDRFPNIDYIKMVRSPVFIVHGKQDKIINCSHSYKLLAACESIFKKGHFPDTMGHNNFELYDDLIIPVCNFLDVIKNNDIYTYTTILENNQPNIDILKHYNSKYLSNLENFEIESFESKSSDMFSQLKINNYSKLQKTDRTISKDQDSLYNDIKFFYGSKVSYMEHNPGTKKSTMNISSSHQGTSIQIRK